MTYTTDEIRQSIARCGVTDVEVIQLHTTPDIWRVWYVQRSGTNTKLYKAIRDNTGLQIEGSSSIGGKRRMSLVWCKGTNLGTAWVKPPKPKVKPRTRKRKRTS